MPDVASDTGAFEEFEATGWEKQASGYADFFTGLTGRTVDALLDAAHVGPGTRVLDVATGPGHVAEAAAARGARVIGVDLADAMLAIARSRWPTIEFHRGDAHDLPFPNGAFEAVVGNFAILHLGRPERAAAEFTRVLAPRGRLALTTWDLPERNVIFRAVVQALDASGVGVPADIPAGPPFFRFSNDGELRRLLEAQGLTEVAVTTLTFTHEVGDAGEVWGGLVNGTVRTAALISGHPPATQERIRQAFIENLEPHRRDDRIALPVSVRLASGEVVRGSPPGPLQV